MAPLLLDAFGFAQLQKPPAGKGKDRALDWSVLIKVSKADAQKQKYQEGMMAQGLFLLAGHLHGWAYSIAFPEMVVPSLIALKKLGKKTKIASLQQRVRRLVGQLEAHATWVLRAREAVDFAPKDAEQVAAFLADEREARAGPFSKWFAQEEAAFEKAEAEWRAKADAEAHGGIRADRDGDDGGDDDDDEEEEEAPRKRKKKKQPAPRDEPPPRKAARHGGGRPHAEAPDVVDELRLSDLEDEG